MSGQHTAGYRHATVARAAEDARALEHRLDALSDALDMSAQYATRDALGQASRLVRQAQQVLAGLERVMDPKAPNREQAAADLTFVLGGRARDLVAEHTLLEVATP